MILRIPTATSRIQLRGGLDFAGLSAHLNQIADLGVSHLYLSPIFTATEGSTHGYDITDPTEIDPVLGGRAGFDRLAEQAAARGLGIILDIVPNHTAFSVQNPWLADVLARGRASDRARHFDIDWQAGPLVLPWLPEPFEKMLTEGAFRVQGGHWHFGDMALPLAPGSDRTDDLRTLHEAQNWRLVHYAMERDAITHRRFFNVTDLIGMRVEDPRVFDDTHALIFDLVRGGQVQGLRVDHIDGLADPAGYLDRLAEALPVTPVWIEKILTGDEALPKGWKTVGTTGYEAGRLMSRMLTPAAGIAVLDREWREQTGETLDFHAALTQAKHDVLDNELGAERRQLTRMAALAIDGSATVEPGPETLREAVTALLVAMPCYRTYVTSRGAGAQDRDLIAAVTENAAKGLRHDEVLRALSAIWADPGNHAQMDFVVRLQQVSGALIAKSQEDTAGFRWTRYLPGNEVGCEPDEVSVTSDQATHALAQRRAADMVLTSSHDSKRSEDARARLIAASHLPDDLIALDRMAAAMPEAAGVPGQWRWYMVQSALAIHGADEAPERLSQHVEKAMREAKEVSFWTNPDEDAETRTAGLGRALLAAWDREPPAALTRLLDRSQALVLMQLLVKMVMPGFPDIYQGTQDLFLALTDPDNRRAPDWDRLSRIGTPADAGTGLGSADAGAGPATALGSVKARWTRDLLRLRQTEGDMLRDAEAVARIDDDGVRLIRQSAQGRRLTARLDLPEAASGQGAGEPDGAAILDWTGPDGCRVRLIDTQTGKGGIDN
ncbi:malto-oligosyltrehalose synthase [Paracoccus nototheniae]|uniref:Malto-oligosyltrehalose synthase n=1 Tax=Paracoccus nototheniae TaxID=2489002 RepID=A0ABW4DY34_9RHOB|nr:malto-oligosyltrehalose synthase [Paracoccus nototheniae]